MRFPLSSLLFLSVFSLFFYNPISAQCLEDQKTPLLTLFSSDNDLSWTPNTDCCSWEGITCDSSTGHVMGLDLTNRWMHGPFNSTALISISTLQILNLSINRFDGYEIPTGLHSLANLTHLNLSASGFSGPVPFKISRMKSLVSLDLSMMRDVALPSPDFEYIIGNLTGLRELCLDGVLISAPVPEFMADLANLSLLHLNECNLSGEFPSKIFHMPNLKNLDISYNSFLTGALPDFPFNSSLQIMLLKNTNFHGHLPDSIGNLKFLTTLDLHACSFDGVIPSSISEITQLVHLDLYHNQFSGQIPSLARMAKLVHLDLSQNCFDGHIPSLANSSKLVTLYLSWNSFNGQITSLGKLSRLSELDLSRNHFRGQIPSLNLTRLVFMDLSSNNFSGQVPALPSSDILYLDLSNNVLSGQIPSFLFMLPCLVILDLSHNQFDRLDEVRNASSSLTTVNLNNNKLQGQIPRSIFQNVSFTDLALSSNNFSGTVNLAMVQNLRSLDLSDNRLSINIDDVNSSSFPQLASLRLRSCNLTKFPNFLANQSLLSTLDLSSNKIDGEMPKWIWNIGSGGLIYLNLCHNMLTSMEQPPIDILSSYLSTLDLHCNKISGQIPPSIFNMRYIDILDLSDNNFSGTIPQCFGPMNGRLLVLNLGKNNLSGKIPRGFWEQCTLEIINLNENRLEGSLPRFLANCTQLEVLNVGNNQLTDSFPSWLGPLQSLRILILRSNMFYGPVEREKCSCDFPQMQMMDLSSNDFTGKLSSKFFQSWQAMMADGQSKTEKGIVGFDDINWNQSSYHESAAVTMKGRELEYPKILTVFMFLDLSNNNFEGNIPEEIGDLKSLIALNMARNNFTGSIPSSFRNLLQLESLDLSANKLSGRIPTELTSLTFLEFLNLSQNCLVGSIPQDKQFSSFSNDSFLENPGLCGPPLVRQCYNAEPPSTSKYAYSQFANTFDWEFMLMGLSLGFGVGIWLVWGPLIFWTEGRRWYYKHMDKMLLVAKAWWEK